MDKPGQGIRLRSSAATSTGQVRENNEDNIKLLAGDHFVLAIVADGMGGAAAGEEASRIAVDTIHEDLTAPVQNDYQKYVGMEEDTLTEMLRDAVRAANLNIVQRAISQPLFKGMGTTLTLALIRNSHAVIAHVGDSRAYFVGGEDKEIAQITADHSFVEALVAAGHITRDEAEDHPMKNVLYRALGQSEDVDIDIYSHDLEAGDRLVLCSDGLTRHVRAKEIADIALAEMEPDKISARLIDLANSRGGEDNISVVVVVVEDNGQSQPSHIKATIEAENEDDTILLTERPKFRRDEATGRVYIEGSSAVEDEDLDGTDTLVVPPITEDDTMPGKPANIGIHYHPAVDSEGRDIRIPDQ